MSWTVTTEQVAIIVPALAAVALSIITSRLQRKLNQEAQAHQEKLNSETLAHQRKMATQDRCASAYEDMLEMVAWQMEFVKTTKPIFLSGGTTAPPEPERERIRRVQARIGVHGSAEVKEILERWSAGINKFFGAADRLDKMQKDHGPPEGVAAAWGLTLPEQWAIVDELRKDLHGIVRDLEDAVNTELRS